MTYERTCHVGFGYQGDPSCLRKHIICQSTMPKAMRVVNKRQCGTKIRSPGFLILAHLVQTPRSPRFDNQLTLIEESHPTSLITHPTVVIILRAGEYWSTRSKKP